MKGGLLGLIPKEESFKKAKDFIMAHPSFSYNEYLRLFIKKYVKKINAKNFPELLVYMFEIIEKENGAKIEVRLARELGMDVRDSKKWLKAEK
jgi:hypothetical protein